MSVDDELRLRTLLDHLVSPRTGVLRRVLLLPEVGGQIPYRHFAAAPASYAALPTGGDIANPGASAADGNRSVGQVAFEAVERYCAAFVDYSQLLRSAPEGEAFLAGRQIQRFADEQYAADGFPFVPVRDESVIHWVLGRSLLTGERRYVPAGLTYLPYQPASPEEILGASFSTGMSAAWSYDDACLGGLLELVERDAFAIAWMNELSGPRLVPAPGSALADRISSVEADGVSSVTLTDISSDIGIPVVCAVLQRPVGTRPLFTVGLSCKMDHATAGDKALSEAISEYERLRVILEDPRSEPWSPTPDFGNVVDFEWHGRVYTDERWQPRLAPLLGNGETVQIDGEFRRQEPGDLLDALSAVAPHVSDVIAVELTTRDMAELGVRSVKVFAPELVPLNADHRYPYLGHDRLWRRGGKVRADAAGPAGTDAEALRAQFNAYPHPFS